MSHPPEPAIATKIPALESKPGKEKKEAYYTATQFQLMAWKFRRHKAAILGSVVLGLFMFVMVFCEFLAPYGSQSRDPDFVFGAPSKIHLFDEGGKFRGPFVYGVSTSFD